MKKNSTNGKELLVQVSESLTKSEAFTFARTLWRGDKFYLVKVHENPKATHVARRERWVVARKPRKGEIVKNGVALFVINKEKVP